MLKSMWQVSLYDVKPINDRFELMVKLSDLDTRCFDQYDHVTTAYLGTYSLFLFDAVACSDLHFWSKDASQ